MSIQIPSAGSAIKRTSNNFEYPVKPITEIITNGFFTVDKQWVVKYWNRAAEELLKVSAKDIVGKNIWEQFAGTLPVEFYKSYHKAFLGDIPFHFKEYWSEMGTWFDVITYYTDDSLSVSFKSSCHRIQPSQGDQLKALTELYRVVTEVTNDCLWEWDLCRMELFWIDGNHRRVFGYNIENALIPQKFWESRLHPDDKNRVLANLNKMITKNRGPVWEEKYRFQKANGDYAFVSDRGQIIYDKANRASRMIGATQDITEMVLLEKKLVSERQAKQKEITDAVLTALENEREEIGKELHDNLGQVLAVAKLYLQMGISHQTNKEVYLKKSCDLIVNVLDDIRKISKNLVVHGSVIGLFGNIRNLVDDLAVIHPIKIEFLKKDVVESEMDEKLQMTIYRIIQEQINNILKHANATKATISLARMGDNIVLLISDNGVGCDISKKEKGVGIINIKSRAELYNGFVLINSKPGKGYEMKVELAMKAHA